MDEPLPAKTSNEVRYYLMVTPCDKCGKGPWIVESNTGGDPRVVEARCGKCDTVRSFSFVCTEDPADEAADPESVNPGDEPSRIIDLGQWLSLFYLLVESAAAETSRTEARRAGYRAALCLAEALKFYGDDELPPETAFFSPTSREAFREHAEKFARQRLRDMQAKLPSLPKMAQRIARDREAPRYRWWQLWRR